MIQVRQFRNNEGVFSLFLLTRENAEKLGICIRRKNAGVFYAGCKNKRPPREKSNQYITTIIYHPILLISICALPLKKASLIA